MMNNNPVISVITVCYNSVQTIEATILSVINQTYKNIEYIIIDGGSTDGTTEIINRYKERIAYWTSEPDEGIYDAMNKAVRIAKGDYFFFLNSDDVFYDKEVLSELSSFLCYDNTIYYGNVIQVPDKKVYGGEFNKIRLSCYNICHQSIFYPRKVFDKYLYNMRYKIYADWYLNILCYSDRGFQFQYVEKFISFFSTGGASYVSPKDNNFDKDFYFIIARNFGLFYCFIHLMLPFKVRYERAARYIRDWWR